MDGYAFEAQITNVTSIGVVAEGLRLDIEFAGRLVDGPLSGATLRGSDFLLIRPDGVGIIDAHEVIAREDGATVAVHAEGFVVPPVPMPDLQTVAAPEFVWPDLDLPLHGSAQLRSGVDDLAAVNRTVYGFAGTVNVATGRLAVSARSLAPVRATH